MPENDEDMHVWIDRVLGLTVGLDDGSFDARQLEENLALWSDARDDAIEALNDVIENVRATSDPDAPRVEIILNSIVKNLTERPDTPEAVAQLRRYLQTDDVISAAEEVPPHYGSLDLRAPLLAALSGFGG